LIEATNLGVCPTTANPAEAWVKITEFLKSSQVKPRRRSSNAATGSCWGSASAKQVNINLLRYFSEPATLDGEAKTFLERGMALAMEWATHGLVVPHISQTIDSAVEAINAGLQSLKAGRGLPGKVAVIVDHNLAEEK
jgi:hypothetical protein